MLTRKSTKSIVAVNKISNTALKEIEKEIQKGKENIEYNGEPPSPPEGPNVKIHLHDNQPNVADFDVYFPWACKQFSMEKSVIITRFDQQDHKTGKETKGKAHYSTVGLHSTNVHPQKSHASTVGKKIAKSLSSPTLTVVDSTLQQLNIHATYAKENLCQIKFDRNPIIPPLTIKILNLIIKFYPYLSSVIINCGLDKNVIHQLSELLPDSNISEVTLDGCYVPELNYDILLDKPGQLTYLSLSRCKINDIAVKSIFDKLTYGLPASKTLSVLTLSSNLITDEGTVYIANALRMNRRLKYLNLADNRITDEGAANILSVLKDFPLTEEERETSGIKYMKYAKRKVDIIAHYLKELKLAKDRKPTSAIKKGAARVTATQNELTELALYTKAEGMARTLLGEYSDPYSKSDIVARDSVLHCKGNNTLCYLNLAYNNLGMFTVQKLLEVVENQKMYNRTPIGLLNVRLDGNPMPKTCDELDAIDDILECSMLVTMRYRSSTKRQKSLGGGNTARKSK